MSELTNDSILSASFGTARSHISAVDSHSSQPPSIQIEHRAITAAEELGNQGYALTCSQSSFGSATQIGPHVLANEAALEFKRMREALRFATKAPTTTEIDALFTKALRRVQDARLIITSTDFPEDTHRNSSIIPLPYKATNRLTFGVTQQAQDADLVLRLPLEDKDGYISFETGITCQIIYHPGKDDCLLVNHAERQLRLTNFSSSPALCVSIGEKKSHFLQPGMRRISIDGDNKDSGEYHLAEFWLRERQFDISIRTANSPSRTKRGIDDGAEENVNKRQKRNNDLTGTTLIRPLNKTSIEPRPTAIGTESTDARDLALTSSVQKIPNKTIVSLLDLANGEEADIQALQDRPDSSQSVSAAKGPASYQLRRVKQIAATASASVFHCIRSSELVATKVLRYDRESPLVSSSLWKTEKNTLEKLKHRNVVALKAFDGRMLAIYLEPLPESLYRGVRAKYSQSAIFQILLDISSALVYLKTIPIVHNDIKPRNITYSSQRGAVLIDFGLATSASKWNAGGTLWYLPPDLLTSNSRGSPGDIWALGITMLYLLGKIDYPEEKKKKTTCPEEDSERRDWPILNLLHNDENQIKMKTWLQYIFSVRAKLSPVYVGTGISKLESIVFHMLNANKELRFNAEDISSALESSMAAPLLLKV